MIAERYYGDGNRFREIAAANKIPDPESISIEAAKRPARHVSLIKAGQDMSVEEPSMQDLEEIHAAVEAAMSAKAFNGHIPVKELCVRGICHRTRIVKDQTRMVSFSDGLSIVLFFLGLAVGWATPIVHQRWRTRRTRRFWKKFSGIKRTQVIVGFHPGLESWDPAGLAGVGDVRALTELQAIFVESRLGRLPTIVSINPDDALPKGFDLVLIGGRDVNVATKQVLLRVPGRFMLSDKERCVAITDRETGTEYPLDLGPDIQTDAGVVKRMANPFDEDRQVLIIAGSFGHGTIAGVELCRDKKFLNDPKVASGQPFECLFTTEVLGTKPSRTAIVAIKGSPG